VTRNRRNWLPKAIEYFRLQTYVNRELLIVADGDDVRDLIPAGPSIRLLHVDTHVEIGAKRNFGCERAAGEVIAHWDDDDYSAPGRLADQMERLVSTGKAVTGYRTMRFTDGASWWRYEGSPLYVVGTSLCYRRDWWQKHPFPARMVGEDNEFVTAAACARELAVGEAGDLMHATIHPSNTSVRQLSGASWKRLSCA
jgi:O-antigen biosynthesis protein